MAKKAFTTLPVTLAGLLLAACGSGGAGSRLDAVTPKPVFVVHGGFYSCKLPWSTPVGGVTYTHAKPLIDAAAKWADGSVPYVATCFGTEHDTAWVQTDLATSSTGVPTTSVADVVAQRVAQVGEGAEVVLIGHSWGGWLALRDTLALPATAHVRYLATLDPISWQTCPASTLVDTVLGGTPSGAPQEPCTEAPADLADTFPAVKRRTATWHQYYQDQFSYLHSSAIPEADANQLMTYDGLSSLTAWEAHADVDRDQSIYDGIGTDLAGQW